MSANGLDISQMLDSLGIQLDPKLQLLAQMMESRRAADEEDDDEPDERREEERARERRLRRAFDFLRERNQELASALGACTCWGDPRCTICGGAGAPGWGAPDETQFTRYVVPALHRIGVLRPEPVRGDRDL